MKIKTVAIIGAGAIGSYFIAGLTEKLGDDLWIVAEGERKERLEKNGTCTNDSNCLDFHFSILLKNTAADWNDIPVSGCTILLNVLTIMHEFRGSHHRQDSHRTHNHYPAG